MRVRAAVCCRGAAHARTWRSPEHLARPPQQPASLCSTYLQGVEPQEAPGLSDGDAQGSDCAAAAQAAARDGLQELVNGGAAEPGVEAVPAW